MNLKDFIKLVNFENAGGGSGGSCEIKRVESLDTSNLVNLRDLDSGHYNLYGYFSPYAGSDIAISADNSLVSVIWKQAGSHVICLDPLNAKIVFFEMLVDESEPKGIKYTRTVVPVLDLYELLSIVTANAITLTSPNGTRFNITVADDGTVSASEVTV